MSKFNGTEAAELYASNKSSSSVFKEAHKKDFLAGYKKALEDSCAHEMLEMLTRILEFNIEDAPDIRTEIEQLIKDFAE